MRPTPFRLPTENVSWAPHYPGCSLSNSPCASFSVLAFSGATTCASVSTRPSWALLASSALSRLFIVSRSWRSHTQRTPAGETVSPRCLRLVGNADLAESRLLDRQRYDSILGLLRHAVLQHRLLATDFLQGQFAALVVELLEPVEAVAAVAIILQAWLTLPSCLASSSRPILARMIFCSVVMGRFATPTASRPASACDSPWGQDTSARLSFS